MAAVGVVVYHKLTRTRCHLCVMGFALWQLDVLYRGVWGALLGVAWVAQAVWSAPLGSAIAALGFGQERTERKHAGNLAQCLVDGSSGRYGQLEILKDLGSRMQKMWFQVSGSDGSAKAMMLAPVSSNCPLKLDKSDLKTPNKLLHTLKPLGSGVQCPPSPSDCHMVNSEVDLEVGLVKNMDAVVVYLKLARTRCRLCVVGFTLWQLDVLYRGVCGALLGVAWVAQAVWSAALGLATAFVEAFGFGRRLRDCARIVQERTERKHAGNLAQSLVDGSSGRYDQLKRLEDLGSRMQKMWFQVSGSDGSAKTMILAPVSSNCPLKLDKSGLKTLNKLLHTLKHPLLHPTEEIQCLQEENYVVTIQPLMITGSLKDLIYQVSPLSDWAVKYASYSEDTLGVEMVASYGRQVLEAVLYLHKLGLRPVGHIQSGNIFVEGEVCRLGGYENRLLGYRTRLYGSCKEANCSEDIDVAMFGCVMFEMACGYELTQLVPDHHDYEAIKFKALKEVIEFIFRRNKKGRFLSTMEEILALEFFQEARLPAIEEVWPEKTPLSRDMRQLISRVARGAPCRDHTRRKQGCSLS